MTKRVLNPTVLVILTLLVFVVLGAWQVVSIERGSIGTNSLELPHANKQVSAAGGVDLYASNQALPDLLNSFDIELKVQGLKPDMSSEVFEYADGSGEPRKIEECVEFRYFKDGELAVTVTLIPADPDCFSSEDITSSKLRSLHSRYEYVYAVTQHLTD